MKKHSVPLQVLQYSTATGSNVIWMQIRTCSTCAFMIILLNAVHYCDYIDSLNHMQHCAIINSKL